MDKIKIYKTKQDHIIIKNLTVNNKIKNYLKIIQTFQNKINKILKKILL